MLNKKNNLKFISLIIFALIGFFKINAKNNDQTQVQIEAPITADTPPVNIPSSITVETSINDNPTPTKTSIAQDLEFTTSWIKPSVGKNAVAYINITNKSNQTYNLIKVTAPEVATDCAIHYSYVNEQGIATMRTMDHVVIPANSTITMGSKKTDDKNSGIHIMLLNLKKKLILKDKIKLVLAFKELSTQLIEVEVKSHSN